jgi:hypothetical protein
VKQSAVIKGTIVGHTQTGNCFERNPKGTSTSLHLGKLLFKMAPEFWLDVAKIRVG